jgi:hypothetical protein
MANIYHIVQVLWWMVQLRHQRFLPDVPRLALRQLPLLYGIDVSDLDSISSKALATDHQQLTDRRLLFDDLYHLSQLGLFGEAQLFFH